FHPFPSSSLVYRPLLLLLPFPTRRSSDLCAGTTIERPPLLDRRVLQPQLEDLLRIALGFRVRVGGAADAHDRARRLGDAGGHRPDRKSTRLNSSHQIISYAVFCLKKKKKT